MIETFKALMIVCFIVGVVSLLIDAIDAYHWARFDGRKNMQRKIDARRKDMGMF